MPQLSISNGMVLKVHTASTITRQSYFLAIAAISASWLADNGLNLTASYGGNDDTDDPTNIYFKVGFKHGKSAYGIDVSETTDKAAGDGSSFSLGWVNNVMQGVQIYASYREESLDDVSGEDDITALVGGARVKF